jgi:hypothetical protein
LVVNGDLVARAKRQTIEFERLGRRKPQGAAMGRVESEGRTCSARDTIYECLCGER